MDDGTAAVPTDFHQFFAESCYWDSNGPTPMEAASAISSDKPKIDVQRGQQPSDPETDVRSGPRNLDSGLSEISIVFQAAVPKLVASK